MARRVRRIVGPTAGLLLAIGLASSTIAQERSEWSWHDRRFAKDWTFSPSPDEILVVFAATTPRGARLAAIAGEPLAERYPFDPRTRAAVYRITSGESTGIAPRLAAKPEIEHAVPGAVGPGGIRYFLPDRLTVRFDAALDDGRCRELIRGAGSQVIRDYWTPGYYLVTLPPGRDVFQAVRSWYELPGVTFAEPLWLIYDDLQHIPGDPLFPDQWHLHNIGQNGWTPGADVMAPEAWDIETGDPTVLIVVIDTGVEQAHEDLAANVIPQNGDDWNFDDPQDDSAEDWHGHGTNCAGIAVGVQDNGVGVSGIAPGCALMPLRIDVNPGQNANRADAINYAASRRGEFDGLVMSCSWGLTAGDFTAVEMAVEDAHADDCVLVFAGGNSDEFGITFPAGYPEAIAVTASSPCDERKSPTSCDGVVEWGSNFGPALDVVAPGVFITTTDMAGNPGENCGKNQFCGGLADGSYNDAFEGASAATPLVAGICGLLYSINPCLSNDDVRGILRATAEDQVGDPNEDVEGFDHYMGYGRANAYRAVEMARGWGVGPKELAETGDGRCQAWADHDDDGDLDVYLGNDGLNQLLSNDGDGTFTDVTSGPLGDGGEAVSVAWADYDNDQDEDLYVTNAMTSDRLLRNDGGGDFALVSGGPLGDTGDGRAVAWADYDKDGHIDFYLTKWQETDRLYRNDGDGTFTDVTSPPLGDAGAGSSCSWADFDDDGDLDLYLLKGAGQSNVLYRNDGAGAFADVTAGPLGDTGHGTAGAWADYDKDDDPDLYLANLGSSNRLLRNDGGGTFVDVTSGPEGVSASSRGAAWGDYDNDGDLDLYVVDEAGPNLLIRSTSAGPFFESSEGPLVWDAGAGRAAAWVDYDDDGDLDAYVVNANGSNQMIRNCRQEFPTPLPSCSVVNHWVEFDVDGNGSVVPPIGSNGSGVGTRLRIVTGNGDQSRWIGSGEGSAQPPLRAHFGLGRIAAIDTLEIDWPSGFVQVFTDIPVDARFHLFEGMATGVQAGAVGEAIRLLPNRPNPFRTATRIPFVVPRGSEVRLEIYDSRGRRVRTLGSGYRTAGRHELGWDGRNEVGAPVSSGVYFYRLTAGELVSTRKLVVLR